MSEDKRLEWGQTPWDNLSREELLRHIQRLYSACLSARGALGMISDGSLYWSREGTGGRALAKTTEAVEIAEVGYSHEDIYRSFFRYADDLLFPLVSRGWDVCPECGTMLGATLDGERMAGKPCSESPAGKPKCKGVFRPLEWSDLAPKR